MVREAGLNPFEFRAGICLVYSIESPALYSLNPFEFRAGICFCLTLRTVDIAS